MYLLNLEMKGITLQFTPKSDQYTWTCALLHGCVIHLPTTTHNSRLPDSLWPQNMPDLWKFMVRSWCPLTVWDQVWCRGLIPSQGPRREGGSAQAFHFWAVHSIKCLNCCRVGFALNLTMADPRALVAFLIGLSFSFIPGILWSLGW